MMKKTISQCMIVKNEEKNIRRALSWVLYALYFFFGTLKVSFFAVPLKAFLPMELLFNFADLIVIFFSFLHPTKACFPMEVTFFPIVIFFSFFLFANAFGAMLFTW